MLVRLALRSVVNTNYTVVPTFITIYLEILPESICQRITRRRKIADCRFVNFLSYLIVRQNSDMRNEAVKNMVDMDFIR